MGIETSPPDVEESTEPPIRSSIHEDHQQHPGSTLNQSPSTDRHTREAEEVSKCPSTAVSLDHSVYSTLDQLQKHQEICEYAYSYPISEVFRAVGVDLQ